MSGYDHAKPWLERPPIPCTNPACDWLVIGEWVYQTLSKEARQRRHVRGHGAKGYCDPCYNRLKRNGTLDYKPRRGNPRPATPPTPCKGGCGRLVSTARSNRRPKGVVANYGRGLCTQCYKAAEANDTLADYEVRVRSRDEVIEEYLGLRLVGVRRIADAAPRIGMTPKALERALQRARKAGDERLAS